MLHITMDALRLSQSVMIPGVLTSEAIMFPRRITSKCVMANAVPGLFIDGLYELIHREEI